MTASTAIVKLEVETDRIGRTVFVDGSRTLLDSEAPPGWSLVTEPSMYTMRSCGLLFS